VSIAAADIIIIIQNAAWSTSSDGARCLEMGGGVHENPDLPEAFHERRMYEFTNLD